MNKKVMEFKRPNLHGKNINDEKLSKLFGGWIDVPSTNPFPWVHKAVADFKSKAVVSSRCYHCKKKVRLAGFRCRCGGTFCGFHRYPEEHSCKFDYKAVGHALIAQQNPLIKIDKLPERI